MDFSQRKLPKDAAEHLRECAIGSVKSFTLMMAPAYVYMKLNEKFVMVKAALDFFTEEELARLAPFESLYFPQEVDVSVRYRRAAAEVRSLLEWKPLDEKTLAPASYETSDAVIRLIAPLWMPGPQIDPFFVSVFVNELCENLPGELLKLARDRDVSAYERGVLCSSWTVFLALHLGYSDLAFLNRLRARSFEESVGQVVSPSGHIEVNELVRAARESLGGGWLASPGASVRAQSLVGDFGRTSEKLSSRIRRVEGLMDV